MNSFRAALILGALASAQTPTVITSLKSDGDLTTFTVQPTTGLTASSTLTTSTPSSSSSTSATSIATATVYSSSTISTTPCDPYITISPPLTFGPSVTSYTQTSYPSTTGSPVGNGYGSPSLTALPCAETSLQNPTITPMPHPSVYNPPSQQYGDPSLEGTYSPQDLSLPRDSSIDDFVNPYLSPSHNGPILSGSQNVLFSAAAILLSGMCALLL